MIKKENKSIAWFDNQWDKIANLKFPLQDRGLHLGDGIFETILIHQGFPQHLQSHIKRWEKSALLLGMANPPEADWIEELINQAVQRCNASETDAALRINWSRGCLETRGINIPISSTNPSTHRFWLEFNCISPTFQPITTLISKHERRNPYSNLSQCKTFGYGQSIQARREAQLAGFDDALLLSTNNELCCGSTANILIFRKGKWLTPRLKSGCLPGVMRQQGLNRGLFQEAELSAIPQSKDQWVLMNSLGCRPIQKLNNTQLEIFPKSSELWQSLLMSKRQ